MYVLVYFLHFILFFWNVSRVHFVSVAAAYFFQMIPHLSNSLHCIFYKRVTLNIITQKNIGKNICANLISCFCQQDSLIHLLCIFFTFVKKLIESVFTTVKRHNKFCYKSHHLSHTYICHSTLSAWGCMNCSNISY